MITAIARELHLWRLLHLGANPLVRGVDRIESVAFVAVVALALAVSPMAFVVGDWVHGNAEATSVRQHAQRHQAVATVIDDPARNSETVTAAWQLLDGSIRRGEIVKQQGDRRGDQRTIWIDRSGAATERPMTSSAALVQAVLAAASVLLVLAAAALLMIRLVRITFDRKRYRHWETEWQLVPVDPAT